MALVQDSEVLGSNLLDMGNSGLGLGLRDNMLARACNSRRPLDISAGGTGKANYIFLGDLNTIGMRYTIVFN